jgi:putative ABC transport system permease protein
MTLGRLLLQSLRFHRRGNLAVMLGAAVGTAVLTGALLVGDSLRGSLRDLTLRRLGWVDEALVTGRFFREALAKDVHASPAIISQAAATAGDAGKDLRRAGRVTLLAVDNRFWSPVPPSGGRRPSPEGGTTHESFWSSAEPEVVLNRPLADELRVKPGDTVTIHLQKVSAVPRETLLGRRDADDVLSTLQLKVRAVLPEDSFGSAFTLTPSPAPPRNAFVPLRLLQEKLDQRGRVNALFAGSDNKDVQAELNRHITLDDWGLVLYDPAKRAESLFARLNKDGEPRPAPALSRRQWQRRVPKALADRADDRGDLRPGAIRGYYDRHPYLSLESRQAILEPAVVEAAQAAANELGLQTAPTLVYLVNNIAAGQQPLATAVAALAPDPIAFMKPAILYRGPLQVPYSIVAAVDPAKPSPLGPFLPEGLKELRKDTPQSLPDIVLIDWPGWKEHGLELRVGEAVALTYFKPEEEEGRLTEQTRLFRLAGILPLHGVADDADLTPEFPGITDQLDIVNWSNPPFPYDRRRIRPNDVNDRFWHDYRTTPKAYIALAEGQRLWGTDRFGKLTSMRFAPPAGREAGPVADEFRKKLLARLDPAKGGFVFDPVKQRSLEASGGGMDFGLLFLGFSFFLIIAALLLIGLLFRLNIDRRAGEIGLLLALGYRRRTVRWLLIGEGTLLAALGGLIGLGVAVVYAWGLIDLLRSWWPGGMDRSFLTLQVTAASLAIGYLASLAVGLLTIVWAVRVLGKVEPRALLAGEGADTEGNRATRQPRWSLGIAVVSLLGGVAALVAGGRIHEAEAQAGTFFTGGFLLLTAGLAGLWMVLRLGTRRPADAAPHLRVASLAIRNAARHPVRSLLTAGLLASAAFLIVAVESFRRQPDKEFLEKTGGSGGFAFLAESDVPIYQDLNAGPGRADLLEGLARTDRDADFLQGVTFVPCRLRTGDDASCLNLFQPRKPRLLGVPKSLIERGGFQFAGTSRAIPESRAADRKSGDVILPDADAPAAAANPWLLLKGTTDGLAIPVFAETNTAQWMLKKGLGDVLEVPDAQGKPVPLRIVSLLQDSVFQSELVMSADNFLRLYPNQEGYNFFLIEAPLARAGDLKPALETALASRGFEVTPSAQRLAAYLAVENTYLSTFQALGGLGLLLGALGLAVVLLRSVWERRGEMALLRALGFRRRVLGWLVLVENAFLLAAGLGIGTAAALASVAPHVVQGAGDVPWLRLAAILLLVLVVGLAAGAAAMAATVRAPLVPALRRE